MPAVAAAAILGGAGAMVSAGSIAITSSVIGMAALNAALAGASMLLQKKPKGFDSSTLSGTTVTGYGATNPRQVIYGKALVGGTVFFQHATGSNNEYLHLCIAYAGHEVESFEGVMFDDYTLTLSGNDVTTSVNSSGATVDYTGYAWIYKHNGSDTQTADTSLISYAPDKWTTDHRAQGVAYLYIRLKWSSTLFSNGLPQIKAIIKGKKVYDPRTLTTAWSDNTALCLRDYITNGVNAQLAVLGLGASEDEVDDTSFIAAANVCDENVAKADGSTEKRYTCNGVFDTGQSCEDTLGQIRMSMAGVLTVVGGKFICFAGAWRTPESTALTESDVLDKLSIQTAIQRIDLFNGVKGTYISPDNNYTAADFPSVKSDVYMADDGNERLWNDLTLAFTNSSSMAQRIAKVELLRGRQPITVSFKAPLSSVRFTIGDIIPLTFDKLGWSGKYFECVNQTLSVDTDNSGNPYIAVGLLLRETSSTIYDWDTDEESTIDQAPNTSLPSPFDIPTPTGIALSSGTADLFVRTDGTIWTRIRASWTASARASVQSGGHYELQYKKSSDSVWSNSANATGDATQSYINDVEDGVSYDVRIRAVSFMGTFSPWVIYTNYEVVGKTEAPTNASGFLVRRLPDGTRKYTWTPPVGVYDLAGYEIRYSTTLSDTWGSMSQLHNGVLTSSPYESNNPPKGTYRFAIKSVDRSGNYSTDANYLTVTLGDARISGVVASYDFRTDYAWAGTLTSCHVDSGNGNIEADGGQTWSGASTWDGSGSWMDGCSTPIVYESNVLDIGSSQTFFPILDVIGSGSHTLEYKSSADGVTWTSYTSVIADTTARYVRFRDTVATIGSNPPTIQSFTATLNIA